VPVSGHDKELFFRKWGEISGLGVYPSLCELVEGIVTVPQLRASHPAMSEEDLKDKGFTFLNDIRLACIKLTQGGAVKPKESTG
jgi:hypothetical protein